MTHMSYSPKVFPLMVPPGFRSSRSVFRSGGTACPNNPGPGYRSAGQMWPPERPILYDSFNETRGDGVHRALDITCADGTPVVSPVDGFVKTTWRWQGKNLPGAGTSERGGGYVWIDGDDGFSHYFAHMRSLRVEPGQRVVAGQVIGLCSDTGSAKGSCPHLHYAVENRSGQKINPFEEMKQIFAERGWQGTPIGWEQDKPRWPAVLVAALSVVGGVILWRSLKSG